MVCPCFKYSIEHWCPHLQKEILDMTKVLWGAAKMSMWTEQLPLEHQLPVQAGKEACVEGDKTEAQSTMTGMKRRIRAWYPPPSPINVVAKFEYTRQFKIKQRKKTYFSPSVVNLWTKCLGLLCVLKLKWEDRPACGREIQRQFLNICHNQVRKLLGWNQIGLILDLQMTIRERAETPVFQITLKHYNPQLPFVIFCHHFL